MVNWKDVDRFLWTFLSTGTYELGLETFFPQPGFRPEGVEEWRQIRQFPLMAEVTECSVPQKQATGSGTIETSRAAAMKPLTGHVVRLTDARGKKCVLYDIQFHVGSLLTTPRQYVLGEDVQTRTWYRIDFDSMKSMEGFIKPVDPLTGMSNPAFSRIVKRDGEVLELMSCKPCSISGYLSEGRRVSYWASQVKKIEFLEPGEEGCPETAGQGGELHMQGR
jgi:hypothetical protein